MPLIQGQEITSLISLFESRCAYFYHACQLKDFKTYLKLDGVPSRNLMQSSGLPYTQFDTDNEDLNNGVWEKVFGNLEDFGVGFALGKKSENTAAIPIPYGPIQLIFKPNAFLQANDIAICLRSAGGQDFDRVNEALSTAAEVDRIFTNSLSDAKNNYEKAYIKRSNDLKNEFKLHKYRTLNPEVSMTIPNQCLKFTDIEKILVDDYTLNGKTLISEVKALLQQYNINCGNVFPRTYMQESADRKKVLQEVANFLATGNYIYSEFRKEGNLSEYTIDWLNRIEKGKLSYQFDRFAKYLRGGTVLEL